MLVKLFFTIITIKKIFDSKTSFGYAIFLILMLLGLFKL